LFLFQKMAMSNAERQRKFRENRKNDPQKRASYIANLNQKYENDKQSGKKKLIKDLTERGQRAVRMKWKKEKRTLRKRNKEAEALLDDTPAGPSRQKSESVQNKNRNMAKCYRDMKKLKATLRIQERKTELYKKRCARLLKGNDTKHDSPKMKTSKQLRHYPQKEIQRTLTFHNALLDQIKSSHNTSSTKSKKQILSILSGSILRKYKLKSVALDIC
jgi:hypothetical protein